MIQIKIFTQQTLFVVLLISNTTSYLTASPIKSLSVINNNQQVLNIFQKIKNSLVEKGLDNDAAMQKTSKLLESGQNTPQKLQNLYESSELALTEGMLVKALVKYALYEKTLDLNSYSSVLGLVQTSLSRPLNHKELNYIQRAS